MDNFPRDIKPIEWPHDEKYKIEYDSLSLQLNSREPFILFIGAGASKDIYPDWEELVELISSEMSIGLSEEEKEDKAKYADRILERCRQKNKGNFYSILRKLFNPEGKIEFKPLHLDLLTLPFVGYITTNIDICLKNAASRLPNELKLKGGFHYYPDHLPAAELKDRCLFHIHGIAFNQKKEDTIENTILTESDYSSTNYSEKVEPFLRAAFNDVCVVFIGFSFRDAIIKRILEGCKKYQDRLKEITCSRTTKDVSWFIFLNSYQKIDPDSDRIEEDKGREDSEDKYLSDTYRLRVIRYRANDKTEHTELNNIVNNLIIETEKVDLEEKAL